jgi:steroid delta-isomerase-like uncharacterized protein
MRNFNQFFCYCLLSITIITSSCYGQEKSSSSDIKKLAIAWIETLNKHDTDALALFYDEHVQVESPNWEGVQTGRAMAKQTYSRYFSSTPDLKFELSNLVVADDAVVIEYRSFGTLSNPEKPTPDYMRGKKYSLLNCTRMNIEKGKIIKQASYFDQVAFLRQMGFFDR